MTDQATSDIAIEVNHVSKAFKLPHEKQSSIKSVIINFRKRRTFERQQALNDISLQVKKGEFFGIVGRNGSGKSTLLKLLAGIYVPTLGEIRVNGNLTPFIELGVGFNPELTGRENVFLNGALLGINRKQMQGMYKDIVSFAELERFMDQKLKNYSSGMQVRLAFSIAIRAQSDILLLDEVLAVGDTAFQQKCYEYFRTLKNEGKTVVFVSHDRGAVESFCDKCVLIDNGEILAGGPPTKVLNKYNTVTLGQMNHAQNQTKEEQPKNKKRWGTRDLEIVSTRIINKDNNFSPNEVIEVKVDIKANKNIANPVYGIIIKRSGSEKAVLTTNTKVECVNTGELKAGGRASVTYKINNIFGNGKYQISPAISNEDTTIFFDWREGMVEFFVSGWDDTFADLHPPHTITVERDN